jgi:hypothetical protein
LLGLVHNNAPGRTIETRNVGVHLILPRNMNMPLILNTGGGDVPRLNPVIPAVTLSALGRGFRVAEAVGHRLYDDAAPRWDASWNEIQAVGMDRTEQVR